LITKQQIIDTSANLMKCFGLKSISMDDLSAKVGISKKTLYQLVSDKNELIQQIIKAQYYKTKANLEVVSAQSADRVEELIRINLLIIRFLQEISPVAIYDLNKYYPELHAQSAEEFRNLFSGSLMSNIKAGKLEGIYRNDINEELITQLHVDRIGQMQEAKAFWGTEASAPHVIKEMTTYYLRGLITEKGEQLLNKHILEFSNY
jgi:AcrR family transcriptional regulator